jgi:GAF domain-containing protein
MIGSQRISEVFVELVDTLVTDLDVVDFMTVLAHRSVELLEADEAGVMLADDRGVLRSVAASHEGVRLLELFELQNDEGPCLDCFHSGEPIANQMLTEGDQWQHFSVRALGAGFQLVHALPMRMRGRVIGALNVFATDPTPLGPEQLAVAQALADVATVGLLQERTLREARVLNEQLQATLTSRIVVEQAKGMLAERLGVDMDDAFERLRSHAGAHGTKLGDVARAVLDGSLVAADLRST